MPRYSAECNRLLTALKASGCRMTDPRRSLVRLLADTRAPLSVHEMHKVVNEKSDKEEINVVTVYRFANLLVELGLARRIELGEGYYRYECAEPQEGPHHHHMVCQSCGKIEDFNGCDIGGLTAKLELESGFRIERHQLELYGTCPACQTT